MHVDREPLTRFKVAFDRVRDHRTKRLERSVFDREELEPGVVRDLVVVLLDLAADDRACDRNVARACGEAERDRLAAIEGKGVLDSR